MRINTVIVGAGPAGLAVAACLQRVNVPFVILEKGGTVGAAWHNHYERLRLHTDKNHSALPYFPFPAQFPKYPSRDQVIAYLDSYQRHFGLQPRFGERVQRVWRDDGEWHIQSENTLYHSTHVVVATGYANQPHLPTWPGQDDFAGEVLHSSDYRTGEAYKGKRVLVVGFGNSGGEIALDLCEHGAKPTLSVRNPVTVIPRDLLGVPILAIAIPLSRIPPRLADLLTAPIVRALIGDLSTLGLRKAAYGPFTQIRKDKRIPLIDVGTIWRIRTGDITVSPGIERFDEAGICFSDGSRKSFDAVILATGYRPAVDTFLDDTHVVDERGTPTTSGREAGVPGLFFCGFYVSPTGMLGEIAREAPRIAGQISRLDRHSS